MIDHDGRLIAILRGVTPDAVTDIAKALLDAGFTHIEIPMNSPDPLISIEKVIKSAEGYKDRRAFIGGGTVTDPEMAQRILDLGGKLIVAPNIDQKLIEVAARGGAKTIPGVFTPSEAFAAIKEGAIHLKFFPASVLGTQGIKAIKAVIPEGIKIYAVGGVDAGQFDAYFRCGCFGFGIGGQLFKAGMSAKEVAAKATELMAALARS